MNAPDLHSLQNALDRAVAHSPYLKMLAQRFPDRVEALLAGDLTDAQPAIDPAIPLRKALRVAKARQALALAVADLAEAMSLQQVVTALSHFADQALDRAIVEAISLYMPDEPPRGFAAIAMGKHGSCELNYSSDIDPIFIFDPETLPCRSRDEPVEAAVRIGRSVVDLMQTRDADGYVFRVDLRLRPSPEVTPIVLPEEAAISYYESQALPWERAAFIRSRACSGDVALGERFLRAINPFIWRRGLDFGAIGEIRGISQRIRNHHSRGQKFGPGYDLKRGRGGIRDVEFYAQIHQLIFGGRETELRSPATLDALSSLAQAKRINDDAAQDLSKAYRLYRTIEHRLQMVDDQQTHQLPKDALALDNVAKLHGLADGNALLDQLKHHVDRVAEIADALDGEEKNQLPAEADALETCLRDAGFPDVKHAAQRVAHWRSGSIRAIRTAQAQAAFEAVLPALLSGLGAAPDPTHAINQFSNLIERLPSAVNLFRLLEAQPKLLELLVKIISEAPTLAEQLAGRAELLDSLIDITAFDHAPDVATLIENFQLSGDLEARFDHVRRQVGERRFALGVQVVGGACDPLMAAKAYAAIAEAAICVVAEAAIAEYEAIHGRVPQSELVILALGRMGGSELTHASDLDLIFLFTGDFEAESDGAKPLGASHYYNRLVQRVVAGLSVATSAGPLYEVDTRLRPSGAKGPLAVSVSSFDRYQREEAWTWEHMALTRARVVFGSTDARMQVEDVVAKTLTTERDRKTIIGDATKMRSDMRTHKPPKSDLDVKMQDGGLVDLEFAIHVIQLCTRKGFDPDLGGATRALLAQALVSDHIVDAHAFLTRLLVVLRLVAPDVEGLQPSQKNIIAQSCGCADWDDLLSQLQQHRKHVSALWASCQLKKES